MQRSELPIVSYSRLLQGSEDELVKLCHASSTDGCFYLRLSEAEDTSSHSLADMDLASAVEDLATKIFDLPLEDKLSYEMDRWSELQIGGYKPAGKHTGIKEGKRDGFENFLVIMWYRKGKRMSNISKVPLDHVSGRAENGRGFPTVIKRNFELLRRFEFTCDDISLNLLAALSKGLCRDGTPSFEAYHRKGELSTTSLAILKYLPNKALSEEQIGHMAHTDVGSLTLLYTSSPGLQVYRRSTTSWTPATPPPGHVVVNVGDALSFMSKGFLHSCLHRVVPQVGPSGLTSTRYSLAFFKRPELAACFHDLNGREWSGESWHVAKYKIFRADCKTQMTNALLTGKEGFLGNVDDAHDVIEQIL